VTVSDWSTMNAGSHSHLERVGFGGGTMISQGFGTVNRDDAKGAVQAALDIGVRFFDTAHFYGSGQSELVIGEMLEGRRRQVRICTKGGVRYTDPTDLLTLVNDCSYDGLRRYIDESLQRLRTDHVDVYLLHQFDPSLTPEQQMENLARLQQEGLADEVGFCNFGVEACARALATGIPSVVEYSCSLLDRRYVGELNDAGSRGCTRITFGSYVHGLLSETFTPDHEFDDEDWRGRSRRFGAAGTSGNVFFAGDAFARNVEVADRLRSIAERHGLSLAAFVLALSVRQPESDIALCGCRNAQEVKDGLAGLDVMFGEDDLAMVEEILESTERPTENRLGLPA
jgi:aryl-alcohol dehydrogenase-like predicted oxidoreductase